MCGTTMQDRPQASGAEVHVSVAQTIAEVEALRDIWNALEPAHVDSEIGYFSVVAANADQVISSYVVRLQRAGRPDILVAARLENLPVPFRLGYSSIGSTQMKAIVVAFDGVIGAQGPSDQAAVIESLEQLLKNRVADVLLMRNVDPDSSLYKIVQEKTPKLRWGRNQSIENTWLAALAPSLDAFLANRSSKARAKLRREDKLLRSAFGESLRVRCFRHPEEHDLLCQDLYRVSSQTYQAGLGAGFGNTRMERELIAYGLRRGNYRCWMLYIDDKPVAFWAGFGNGSIFYTTTPGFLPEFAQHRVGRFTMLRMIETLCADGGYKYINFGRGDAAYKEAFSSSSHRSTDVWIAADRLWPISVLGLYSLNSLINQKGKVWLQSSGWTQKLKSRWRRRIQSTQQRAGP